MPPRAGSARLGETLQRQLQRPGARWARIAVPARWATEVLAQRHGADDLDALDDGAHGQGRPNTGEVMAGA